MWTEPKTNWIDGEYFNVDPDYNRIKGNIEYLTVLAEDLWAHFSHPTLEEMTINGYPLVSFFNNIVDGTKAILSNSYRPAGSKNMKSYSPNGVAWSAADLNAIEYNHKLLYDYLNRQKDSVPKLALTLGGFTFGS